MIKYYNFIFFFYLFNKFLNMIYKVTILVNNLKYKFTNRLIAKKYINNSKIKL